MPIIKITWIDSVSAGVTNHLVYRDDTLIATVGMGVQEYIDNTAISDTYHKYEVQASGPLGKSATEVDGDNVLDIIITDLTPTLTNFRVESDQLSRVYFDTLLGYPDGVDANDFTISGKIISGITKVSDVLGYFTVTSAFTFWDNNTIRLENGDGTVYDFTLTEITNNIAEPVSGIEKFVAVGGNGSGANIGDPMDITAAFTESNPNTTYWIEKGDYGNVTLVLGGNGTSDQPAKFIGYKTTIGDNPSLVKSGEINFDANEMPLLDGGDKDTAGYLLRGSSSKYIIIKNIQFQRKVGLVDFGGITNNMILENCYGRYAGLIGFQFGGLYDTNKNHRAINCYASNCEGLMIRMYGAYHLAENNYIYQGNSDGITGTDYYISIYGANSGGNCIVKNNHAEIANNLGTNSRHGIGAKASGYPSEYNLFTGNTVIGMKPGIEIRHEKVKYNVAKYNTVYATGISDTTGVEFRDGAEGNIVEYNYFYDCSVGVRYGNSAEVGQPMPASTDNIVRNNLFRDCGTAITSNYRVDKTSTTSTGNIIEFNTFDNCSAMFELRPEIPMDASNLIKNNIFNNIGNLYTTTGYNFGVVPYQFTISNTNFFECGVRNDNSSPTTETDSDNWITPTGVNILEVDPQFDANLLPANEALIAVSRVKGAEYDYGMNERGVATTMGAKKIEDGGGVTPPDELGPETITNGGFDTDSDWTKVGWTIGSGVATSPNTSSTQIRQNNLYSAATYRVTFDVTDYVSGGELSIRMNDGSFIDVPNSDSLGSKTLDYVAGSGSGWFDLVSSINDFVGSVDNVSVKQVN